MTFRIESEIDASAARRVPVRAECRLLIITTRNLDSSIGEWRLIANRSAALQSTFGIATDILYLRPEACMPALLNGHRWFGDCHFLRFRNRLDPTMLSTLRELRNIVKNWLDANTRGYVILSGAQLYLLPLGIPPNRLIVDLHGTLREWIEGTGRKRRDRTLRFAYPFAARAERRILRSAWGALSVSKALTEYATCCGVRRVWRIPCGLSLETINSDQESTRKEWRARFSLSADCVTFVYSGGLSKWQCVREAVCLFAGVRQITPDRCRLVIMTPHTQELQGVLAGIDLSGISICSVPAAQVSAALSCGDIGLLLREDTSTNHNAFPNKFAEYLAAGLFVITSRGLRDPAELVLSNRLGTLVDPDEVRLGLTRTQLMTILDAYHARGDRSQYIARAHAAVRAELSMEQLVVPFAESVIAK